MENRRVLGLTLKSLNFLVRIVLRQHCPNRNRIGDTNASHMCDFKLFSSHIKK